MTKFSTSATTTDNLSVKDDTITTTAEFDTNDEIIVEGLARIHRTVDNNNQQQQVFYNEAQIINRDVSVAVLQVFHDSLLETRLKSRVSSDVTVKSKEKLRIFEGLAASGRFMLYFKNIYRYINLSSYVIIYLV